MPTREEKKSIHCLGSIPEDSNLVKSGRSPAPVFTVSQAVLLHPEGWRAVTESCPRNAETQGRLWYSKPTKYPNRSWKEPCIPQSCRQWWTTHPGSGLMGYLALGTGYHHKHAGPGAIWADGRRTLSHQISQSTGWGGCCCYCCCPGCYQTPGPRTAARWEQVGWSMCDREKQKVQTQKIKKREKKKSRPRQLPCWLS